MQGNRVKANSIVFLFRQGLYVNCSSIYEVDLRLEVVKPDLFALQQTKLDIGEFLVVKKRWYKDVIVTR